MSILEVGHRLCFKYTGPLQHSVYFPLTIFRDSPFTRNT